MTISLIDFTDGEVLPAASLDANFTALKNAIEAGTAVTGATHGDLSAASTPTTMHKASQVKVTDTGSKFATDDVESALAALATALGFASGPVSGTTIAAYKTIDIAAQTDFISFLGGNTPLKAAHGLGRNPYAVIGMLRGDKGGVKGNWVSADSFMAQTAGNTEQWISISIMTDATDVHYCPMVTSTSTGAIAQLPFASATKTYFVLPNATGVLATDWTALELKLLCF